jgi:hypothetical protein
MRLALTAENQFELKSIALSRAHHEMLAIICSQDN